MKYKYQIGQVVEYAPDGERSGIKFRLEGQDCYDGKPCYSVTVPLTVCWYTPKRRLFRTEETGDTQTLLIAEKDLLPVEIKKRKDPSA